MGKQKKKFMDKKKSATFQLLARDSSDPSSSQGPSSDRVFVRVDNNPVSLFGFGDENDTVFDDDAEDPNSIFADAPEDIEDEQNGSVIGDRSSGPLPDHVRKEILELGFPDDGYNYLQHLREIKNAGGGSNYYHNSKAKLDVPQDVKAYIFNYGFIMVVVFQAYDASKVRVHGVDIDPNEKSMYGVASRTVGARIQKVVDPEVAAMLDDSDLSRFGSDVDELDEDFVVQANLADEEDDLDVDEKLKSVENLNVAENGVRVSDLGCPDGNVDQEDVEAVGIHTGEAGCDHPGERPRVQRLLDEQFDMLELQDYGTDTDDEYDAFNEGDRSLEEKLKDALKDHQLDNLELDGKYKVPGDVLRGNEGPEDKELLDTAADVIRRCVEYAEKYENESNDDKDMIFVQESSDESEVWDCETIVSTYSNLDNHPGKIGAPESARRNKLSKTVSKVLSSDPGNVITLRGKGKLPVDFLPQSRKVVKEKEKGVISLRTEQPKRRQHGQESKEEKKERKAAVKEERREARRAKKEMKGLYKFETQRAQRTVAISVPTSIHLM
ncbi:Low temperature viability protein Ltv1 [Dillenia turbinata]|uniref:Low temperature viability protein Ltv1 n=1 Tax=Dillenia turbinata TaxID=194707 RepID=A0AAN8ZM87_9MAGN